MINDEGKDGAVPGFTMTDADILTEEQRQKEKFFLNLGTRKNPSWMPVGYCLLEWMKQDRGGADTEEFFELYHARVRHLSRLIRAILRRTDVQLYLDQTRDEDARYPLFPEDSKEARKPIDMSKASLIISIN